MKKIIIICTCLISLIPISLNAVSVGGASVSGNNEVTIGEEYTLKVNPNINGFTPGYDSTIGYNIAFIEILYDEDVLSLQNATIPYFLTDFNSDEAIKGKGHRIITAVINDESAPNLCAYDVLYCGQISLDLEFFAKNTKVSSTSIEIRNITIVYFDFSNINEAELENMTEEELEDFFLKKIQTTYKDVKQTKTINIKNNNVDTPVKEPDPVQTTPPSSGSIKPDNIKVPTVENNSNQAVNKSSNSYLKKLEIQNYNIDFNKDVKEYEITVGKNVNKIIVSAEAEDDKAIARVKGNDDLNASGNKVTIEVLAENNTTTTYTINIIHKEEETEEEAIIEEKKPQKLTVDKKIIKLMVGLISGIILIGIIIILSTINKRRKLNKMFDEL